MTFLMCYFFPAVNIDMQFKLFIKMNKNSKKEEFFLVYISVCNSLFKLAE